MVDAALDVGGDALIEINGRKFYNLKDLLTYMIDMNTYVLNVGYCRNLQHEDMGKLELSPFYNLIKEAPQLPPKTIIWIYTNGDNVELRLNQELLTTAGNKVDIEIMNDAFCSLWEKRENENIKYEYSRREFTIDNAELLFGRCVKGALVVDELFLPLEVFGADRFLGSIFEQYESRLGGIVMHPAHLYINAQIDLVKCYLLRMT